MLPKSDMFPAESGCSVQKTEIKLICKDVEPVSKWDQENKNIGGWCLVGGGWNEWVWRRRGVMKETETRLLQHRLSVGLG